MAADLHIHIGKNIPINELRDYNKRFISCSDGNDGWVEKDEYGNILVFDEKKIHNSLNVWVGEVSWLKASLSGDKNAFVPGAIYEIQDIFSELPVIDDGLIERVRKAFDLPNTSGYTVSKPDSVISFLEKNRGEIGFTISW